MPMNVTPTLTHITTCRRDSSIVNQLLKTPPVFTFA